MALAGREAVVIGAGIAGLALATALARRGAHVRVLERSDRITEVGAGLQIAPNGAAVLFALGHAAALAGAGIPARAVRLRDGGDGRAVIRLDLDRAGFGHGYHLIHRGDLIALLAQGARAAGVEIRTGCAVDRIEHGPGGYALHGPEGMPGRVGLLLAADGLHSRLRRSLNPSAAPFFTGQVAWRAVIPESIAPERAEAEVFMGPGRHLVSYPLRGGRARNIVAVEERSDWADEGWHHEDDPQNLRRAFAGFGGPVPAWLRRTDRVHLWGLFRHPVATAWHDGRGAAILGDAAHPTLPFLAQGANMALEDAWVLASLLDRHDDTATALAAFQTARQGRVRRIVEAANRNARAYHLQGVARKIAHLGLRLAGRVAPGAPLRRFDWLYRHDVTRQFP